MSHESRTSPPTYPEILDIHDGAFSESIWGSDGFRTIKVSGQDDVIADSYKDNLTISAGTNVTLTTNEDNDTLTIAATPGTVYTGGTGINVSGTVISVTSLAVTNVHEAANQTAQLALTTQEGDVVVRTDENKSYVKNAGTAGSMSDWTLLRTPTDVVLSVAGNTGAVTAAQLKTAYESNAETNAFTDADHTKLDGIEPSATADQTAEEIQDIVGAMLAGNTETGITVTYEDGDGTIDFVVADQTANDFTNTLKSKLDGIENTATADQTDAEIRAAVEAATDSNVFTDTDHSKLNAIESLADVTDTANVTSAGAVMKTTVDALGDLLVASADNTVTRLARGTDNYVLKADSSTATGLVWSAAGEGGDVNQNAFSIVAVSGQDNVAADTTTDTLTLAAGTNITLTTTAASDTVTIGVTSTADATKMPLAGGTFTGDVKINDGEEIRVGSDSDLIIVHDGSNGTIKETTGNLDIRAKNTNGGLVTISDSAGENLIKATAGSSVELTYDGTKKFETTSAGATVTGTLTATLANNSIANAQVADDAIGVAELSATGTASSSTYLRGDNSWATVSTGGVTSDARENTVGGTNAGDSLVSGSFRNTVYGYDAGTAISTGDDNTCLGQSTGKAITTGAKNTLVGSNSGLVVNGGSNTAVGHDSLKTLTSGEHNTAIGFNSMEGSATNVEYNVMIGSASGQNLASKYNVGIGLDAAKDLASDGHCVAIGRSAMAQSTDGSYSVAVGGYALGGAITTGNFNTAVGMYAGKLTTSGYENTYIGADAGAKNTTGYRNCSLGYKALEENQTGDFNVALGYRAGLDVSGDNNILIGADAGNTGSNDLTSGSNNILIGHDAAASSATVSNEITLGDTAITKFRIPGINFVIKDTTATDNYVLTVDSNGEAGWEAAAAGGIPDAGNTATGAFALDRSTTIKIDAGQYLWLTCDQFLNVDVGQYADIDVTQYMDIDVTQYFDLNATQYIALGTAGTERFRITSTGALAIEGASNYGSSGQVLTSNGNDAPTWQAGGGTSTGETYVKLSDTDGTANNSGHVTSAGSSAGTKGNESTYFGYQAAQNSTGGSNTIIGAKAGESISDGGANTVVGQDALKQCSSTSYNTAIGKGALQNCTVSNNTAVGARAGDAVTSANDCVFIGWDAGGGVTEGNYNIAIGNESMMSATTGAANVNVGRDGLRAITSGQKNVNVGNDGNRTGTTASYNVSIGHDALKGNTADYNTAVGYQALNTNQGGTRNTAVGDRAVDSNTSGSDNVGVGQGALSNNQDGIRNTAVGNNAASQNTGSYITAFGYNACQSNVGGGQNTGVGYLALQENSSNAGSTALGFNALMLSTGGKNTGLGAYAGDSITTGSNLTCIGYNAEPSAVDATNEMSFGDTNVQKYYFDTKPGFIVRGWVQFDGSGNMTPNSHGNVDSITDNGTGDYTISWDVDLRGDGYGFFGCAMEDHAGIENRGEMVVNPNRAAAALITSSVRFSSCNSSSGTRTDCKEIYVAVVA